MSKINFIKDSKKSKFEEKLLEVRRVSRVTAGGKRFSYRVAVVVGDRNGQVGVGIAKGIDVSTAIQKARRLAEKKIITVPLKEKRTVPYDIEGKWGAAKIRIKPTALGHGLIAGGSARIILELAGIKDISAKITGRTKNKINNALAAISALSQFKDANT